MPDVIMKRKSLSHDGQQFYQYKKAPLTSKSLTTIKPRHITLEIQVLARDGQNHSFVDISVMVDHHCVHILFIISTISVI